MHELSLSLDIIDLVARSVEEQGGGKVDEVRIEVGILSGADTGVLEEALKIVSSKTAFSGVRWILQPKEAMGRCDACQSDFPMKYLWDVCPGCGRSASKITEGNDLQVSSILVSDKDEKHV